MSIEKSIENINQQLEETSRRIDVAEEKIAQNDNEIVQARKINDSENLKFLQTKDESLRKEKEDLRKEKDDLRKEKLILLDKEKFLLEDKRQASKSKSNKLIHLNCTLFLHF